MHSQQDTTSAGNDRSTDRQARTRSTLKLRRRELLARGALSAGALALADVLAACGAGTKSSTTLVGRTGGDIGGGKDVAHATFGIEVDAVSFDYTQSYDYSDTIAVPSITEPLLRTDQSGRITPNLASSFDFSNPRHLVFQIRHGVRFQDGTPLTAEDVAYSLNRQLDPKVGSLFNFYWARVDHVAVTGPSEVTIFMKQPDAQFPFVLGTNGGGIGSKAFIERHGKQYGTPQVGAMGTGPYRFVSWVKGQSYTLERNPDYWNGRVVPRNVKQVTVHVIQDEATLLAALRAGEIDATISQLSGKGVQSIASASHINQYRVSACGGSHMDFSVGKAPWSDPRVRRALSLVIPRQGLLDSVWGNQGTLVKSIVPPPMWSYGKATFAAAYAALPDYTNTGPTGTNLAQARKLISQAGAHGAKGTITVESQYDQQQAEAIQAAAAQIGLDLSVNLTTVAALNSAETSSTRPKPYDIIIAESTPDFPDPANLLALFYDSKSSQNYQDFDDPQVDEWIAQESSLLNDPDARARLITKIQAVIVGDQVDPVIVSPDTVLTLNSRLGGYQLAAVTWQYDPHFLGSLSGR